MVERALKLQEHHIKRADAFLLMADGKEKLGVDIVVRRHVGEGYFANPKEKARFRDGLRQAFSAVKRGAVQPINDGVSDVICRSCHKKNRNCRVSTG